MGKDLQLGNGLGGHVAHPRGSGPFPALIVLLEAYGITGHIKGVCQRLAKAGFLAVAPDLFHGEVIAYTDMDAVLAKIKTLNDDTMMKEIGITLDWLAKQREVENKAIGSIGFCMGGRLAFLANCRFPDRLQAAVCFYGGGIAPEGEDRFGRNPPIRIAEHMKAPLYLGYGAEDQGIPPAEHARIVERLSALKKRYALAVYPGAGHAFLCEERASYAPAAAKPAWRESINFLHAHLEAH
ncbi:MAG TPA: dienelactone hydrolase family protein [Gammaproteobacteria bacterium]|nr:dienelactone hydrolase family protein [Gammaproteobacteria bacterium]